jgi:NADH:ubiquinone oxidoreductase subunit 2 (subunit N)
MGSRTNTPDLAFACFLIVLGGAALVLGSELTVGTAGSMGPGYVPRALAVLIIVLGLGMGARALLARPKPFPAIAFRPLILIGASVALFALLLPRVGLALTSLAVVVCAGFAATDARVRENGLLAIGLAAFAVALFVYGLGLPIRVWP